MDFSLYFLLWLLLSLIGLIFVFKDGGSNEMVDEAIKRNLENGLQIKHVLLFFMVLPVVVFAVLIYLVYWIVKAVYLLFFNKYTKKFWNFTIFKPKDE